MLGIANRSRKGKRTADAMSLNECMADQDSTIIKGMIALTAAALLGCAGMTTAIIIAAIRLAG